MDNQEVKQNPNTDEIDHLNLDLNEMSWDGAGQNTRAMGGKVMTEASTEAESGALEPEFPAVRGEANSDKLIGRESEGYDLGGAHGEMSPGVENVPGVASMEQREPERNPELGQVIPMMPPGYDEANLKGKTGTDIDKSTEKVSFVRDKAMTGDRLGEKQVDRLQDRERELFSSGDVATFVDDIYDYAEEFQGRRAA